MLQFQSLGTLAATPGLLASATLGWNITLPGGGPKPTGVALTGASDDVVLDALLPARDFHAWKSA